MKILGKDNGLHRVEIDGRIRLVTDAELRKLTGEPEAQPDETHGAAVQALENEVQELKDEIESLKAEVAAEKKRADEAQLKGFEALKEEKAHGKKLLDEAAAKTKALEKELAELKKKAPKEQ